MTDLLNPTEYGYLSVKVYDRGDCKLFRYERLSYSFHKEPMGGGTTTIENPKNPEFIIQLKSILSKSIDENELLKLANLE